MRTIYFENGQKIFNSFKNIIAKIKKNGAETKSENNVNKQAK